MTVDERGERLTVGEIAERVAMKPATWRAYVKRGYAPMKDGDIDGRTPFWYAATVDAWVAARPGRGSRSDRAKK